MSSIAPTAVGVALALSALPLSSTLGQTTTSLWGPATGLWGPATADGVDARHASTRSSTIEPMGAPWTGRLAIPRRRPLEPAPASIATATALSAVLPGAGQHYLGRHRKWAYVAIEGLAWGLYVDRRSRAGHFRDRYRDFAWSEARIHSEPRVDGDFDYYETLSKWQRSGAFDADFLTTGIQPEVDPMTFNGSVWALATRIYLPGGPTTPEADPQYQAALAYYRERAYGDEFLWDWSGTGGAQGAYAELIGQSDRRFRQATNVLGVLLANHVVSAVDAFLTARGLSVPGEARIAPAFGPWQAVWTATVRLSVHR